MSRALVLRVSEARERASAAPIRDGTRFGNGSRSFTKQTADFDLVLGEQMARVALDSESVFGCFYDLHVNDLGCVAAPGPSCDQELRNRGEVVLFHGFDFDAGRLQAADGTYAALAFNSLEGLIVAGENLMVEHAGPSGEGLFAKASQVSIPSGTGRNIRPMLQLLRVSIAPSDQ